jgi:NAD(P)-dependent dehydrogenase (short-subunit alcohol dehydrogenase family)
MVAEGRGRIINVTSYAGVYRWPLMSAYAASKAALVKLTETLAEETRPHGVSVFSVDPGLLPIGLSEAALSSTADRQTPAGRVHRWIRDQFDAGRGADPEKAVRLIRAGQRQGGSPVRAPSVRQREPGCPARPDRRDRARRPAHAAAANRQILYADSYPDADLTWWADRIRE